MSHTWVFRELGLWVGVLVAALPAAAAQSCESLNNVKVPQATIHAFEVAAGPFSLASAAPPGAEGPRQPPMLPAFCRAQLTIAPAIRIEVWLPSADWNGRFQAVGNGGYAGSISFGAMVTALKAGYATASTDTGHQGAAHKAEWALGHPELVRDYAYRAVHEMTGAAKKLIEAYYGRDPQHSYFNGCSTGGRQGLIEAQRYPEDYDGIVAGAPANFFTHLQTGGSLGVVAATLKDPDSYIPPSKLSLINKASLEACDAVDGLKDGLIQDPRKCRFDPGRLVCKGQDSSSCLTPKQVDALKKIYEGSHYADGRQIYPGNMPGHEQGWVPFITGKEPLDAGDYWLGVDFMKYMVYDNPNWDFRTANFDKDTITADEKLASELNATDPNLAAFRAHGGKLLLYHGWTDPAISSLNTINYFKSVVARMAGVDPIAAQDETAPFVGGAQSVGDFVRLFMVPGMDHCSGGPGPNIFDALDAVVNWVERNRPPDKLMAKHSTNGNTDRTRPLCPYPQTAHWTGQGSTDDAANFVCKLPAR